MTRTHHFAPVKLVGAVGLGLFVVLASQGQAPLPAADLAKLIAMDAKSIEVELAKTTFSKKGQKKVAMAAFMIAVYAQESKDNSPAMATLRDQALKVMNAAQAGKADETKTLAATLSPTIKPDPASKSTAVALERQLDLESLMRIFSGEKVGGFGVEKSLEDLVDAKGLDAAQLDKAHLLGQKISLIAKVAHAYAPANGQGKKTKSAWNTLATEMQKNAGDLAGAAQAKKEADISKIATKLADTCTKCHDIFR
jgi:hypothetical protein